MDHQLAKQLLQFITKIAAHEGKSISEIMRQQEAPTARIYPTTEPDEATEDDVKFYEDLLKLLKPEKAPNIPYINLDEEEEERQGILNKILEDAK